MCQTLSDRLPYIKYLLREGGDKENKLVELRLYLKNIGGDHTLGFGG